MDYKLTIERRALKSLARIPKSYQQKIMIVIDSLKIYPRPIGSKKLTGRDGWRIRVNNYRIIYIIKDDIKMILVLDIGHRKDIYHH